VLGNASGFTFDYFSLANGIKETSFTVINVSHNCDDWRADA